jgi:hypothetical protein
VVRFEFVLTPEAGERLLAGGTASEYDAAVRSTLLDVVALAVYWLPVAALAAGSPGGSPGTVGGAGAPLAGHATRSWRRPSPSPRPCST